MQLIHRPLLHPFSEVRYVCMVALHRETSESDLIRAMEAKFV